MWKNLRPVQLVLMLILVTLPVQQAWIRPLEYFGAPNWLTTLLTAWSAPFLLLFAGLGLWRIRTRFVADYAVAAFIGIALLPIVWQWASAGELLIGWRYTLLALISYWIGRSNMISGAIIDRCLRIALWLILAGAGLQLLFWLVGSQQLIAIMGFEPYFMAGSWRRVFGVMSGPNQLGTFLVLAGAWLWWRKQLTVTEAVLVIFAVILTFSRSALLALIAATAFNALLFLPTWRQRVGWGITAALVALAVGVSVFNIESFRTVLVENRHADLRIELLSDTAEHFRQSTVTEWLIGHGSGTAGPAAAVINKAGFIPENWFLQIAYENGLIGVGLILSLFTGLVVWAIRRKQPALSAIVFAIGVNSLFLHPLSDNFAAALWFYLLIATVLFSGNDNQNTVQYQQ